MDIETPLVARPPTPDKAVVQDETQSLSNNSRAFFPNSRHFIISGGNFTNIINSEPPEPSNFRKIAAGDLVLKEAILEDNGSVTLHRKKRVSRRRVYSAGIYGNTSKMTVAVYDGMDAEKNWRDAIASYSCLRHPNVVQLFGTTQARNYYTAIFHDDLISARKLLLERSESGLWTVYFRNFLCDGFRDAASYISSVMGGRWVSSEDCTMWIRHSTGQVCLELTPGYDDVLPRAYFIERREYQDEEMFDESVKFRIDDIINSTTLLEYYDAFCEDPANHTLSELPASASLGSVLNLAPDAATVVASTPAQSRYKSSWRYQQLYYEPEKQDSDWNWEELLDCEIVDDRWARVESARVMKCYYHDEDLKPDGLYAWLAQADRIFSASKIAQSCSALDTFALVVRITISVVLEEIDRRLIPRGFLFLYCPSGWHSTPVSSARPDSMAFWSLDSVGQHRLSWEEAKALGFPTINANIEVHLKSWDSTTYLFLRQFHEEKGFNPNSEEVANCLGLTPICLSISCADPGKLLEIKEANKITWEESDIRPESQDPNEEIEDIILPSSLVYLASIQCALIALAVLLAAWDPRNWNG
ncbi:kinase-like protein [Favolaschia claudopus]|uniref:Kinase-like protein n=1 Tax=Favolaschia claudopus TaxID=2862362 RepID=A0AAV9ZAG9_9AGAR